MLKYTLFILCLFVSLINKSQELKHLHQMMPTEAFENISRITLNQDSTSSSFLVWIKSEVKNHYHVNHVEHVYVIEGTGDMQLGNDLLKIKSGDYIVIPKKTIHGVRVTSKIPLKVISIQSPKFLGEDIVPID